MPRSKSCSENDLSSRLTSPLALLAIWISIAAVYTQVLQFGFVTWDDPVYVVHNAHVRGGLSLAGAAWTLTSLEGSNWFPLTWLSHMLDVELFGIWAGGHHATNLLLHAADAALLFTLLLTATRARSASAFAAALFALHPLRVEVVAWVSERKELLSTGFGLLAMIAYVSWTRRGGWLRYAAVLLAFAAALACKQMLVTLPFVLLLLDYWPLARVRSPRLVFEKLPLFALSAAACVLVLSAQELSRMLAPELPVGLRLAHAAVAPFRYLALALWPSRLSVLYPHPYAPELGGEPWSSITVIASVAGLAAITAAALAARRRPYLAVGWLWFLGTLVPVIGLVQVGPQGFADRYTYLPLIGPAIALAFGARDAIAALGSGRAVRAVATAVAVCALAVAGAASHERARAWSDSESLYRSSLAATPRNPVLLYNLGELLAKRGRIDEAVQCYEAALAIDPGHVGANVNLGNIRLRAREPEPAIAHYRAALRTDPNDLQALQNLGRVLAWRGEVDEAIALFERAARIAPADSSLRLDLDAARAARQDGLKPGSDPSSSPLTQSETRDLLEKTSSSDRVDPIPAGLHAAESP